MHSVEQHFVCHQENEANKTTRDELHQKSHLLMSPRSYQGNPKSFQKSLSHHHHYHRKRRHHHSHDHHHRHHHDNCPRRHRSHHDVSTTSVNTCHDSCADHEVREILIKRPCCSTSKTELVQYFIEDLYGGTVRRPSYCTSSDYCYHTDSTSLYGSRSSLSRNNSIESGLIRIPKRRPHSRQPSCSSLYLGRLHQSHPNSLIGSLNSIFDKPRDAGSGKMIVSPSKVTIEHQSKNGNSKDLPEYACSPSPIRWSFLADSESKTPSDFDGAVALEAHESRRKKSTDSQSHKYYESSSQVRGDSEQEESTTVMFHQEGEAYNNCCNNYLQCNAFLDQDLQITSEDICEYLSKGNQDEVLNNAVNYPFQPTNNAGFQYKNNFCMSNKNSPEFRRRSSKETNLNQNNGELQQTESSLSPTNINLSTSSNNINIIFNSYLENNMSEVKFINTSREQEVSRARQHYAYFPYAPTASDNTNSNMSSNSIFDKPLGIDEIPSVGSPPSNVTESLETSSSHNLLYYRYASYSEGQQSYEHSASPRRFHHSNYKWHHVADGFKLNNAFRRVRKRASKCAQYLRKK